MVSPTRVACACLATFASASCAARSSANSASGSTGRAVPVVVTCAGIPFSADQRSATPASASLSLQPLKRLRPQRVHRPARLGEAFPRELVAASTCRRQPVGSPGVRRSGLLGRLQLGDDPGQPLRESVVDLPRHPPPLVEDAGLLRILLS